MLDDREIILQRYRDASQALVHLDCMSRIHPMGKSEYLELRSIIIQLESYRNKYLDYKGVQYHEE